MPFFDRFAAGERGALSGRGGAGIRLYRRVVPRSKVASIPRGLEACAACGAAGGVVGRTTQGAQVTPRIF